MILTAPVCVFVFAEVCVKEMAACAADETCKGLHMKVQTLMKKDSGYGKDGEGKEGGYGGKDGDDKKEGGYGGKDGHDKKEGGYGKEGGHGNKGGQVTLGGRKLKAGFTYAGKSDQAGGYGSENKGSKPYGSENKGSEPYKGDKPYKEGGDSGSKGGEDKKPGYGDKEKAPSAELKAAMEACKKNEYCRALMECKMKHKESGGKG